jgi:hypothetical protein
MSFVTAGTAISAQHLTVCNAIRSAGKNTALMIDLFGGGNPGSRGTNAGVTVHNLCLYDQRHVTLLFPRLVRRVFRGPAGARKKCSRHRGLTGGAERQRRADHSGAFQRAGNSPNGSSVDPSRVETVAAVILRAANRGPAPAANYQYGGIHENGYLPYYRTHPSRCARL